MGPILDLRCQPAAEGFYKISLGKICVEIIDIICDDAKICKMFFEVGG